MALHAYATGPIDHWNGWRLYDPEAPADSFKDEGQDDFPFNDGTYAKQLVAEMFDQARPRFTSIGWEGDGVWRYTGFPDGEDEGPLFLLAVKQSNNGTCFILSPAPLPHLER